VTTPEFPPTRDSGVASLPQPGGPRAPVAMFQMTTKIVSGIGSLGALPDEVARLGCNRLAVVADEGVASVGLLDCIVGAMDRGVLAVTVLIGANPDVAEAERAAEAARAVGCDAVLAIGGGSALGAAKAVAIRLTNSQRIDEFESLDRAPHLPAPTIAVPTTAGSGSEVSRVLVLHEPGRDSELVVRLDGEEPRVAFLDATVMRGLPRIPLIYAGLDALSHSLESLWARRCSAITAALATAAADTIIRCLPEAADGSDNGANMRGHTDLCLQQLLEASCMANIACGNSGLTLVHALSGAPLVKLPHGQQNGILLPHVARFNESVSDSATKALVDRLPQLYRELHIEPGFPAGLTAEEVTAMVAASRHLGFRENNRRQPTDDDLGDILIAAGAGRKWGEPGA